MRTKVYTFKPKGRGTCYATQTSHSRRSMGSTSSRSGSKRSGGAMSNFVSGSLARFIVRGLFGIK